MGMEAHRPVFGKLSPLSGWTRKWKHVPLLQQIYNVLDSIDAIIIPGGSGKSQYLNLGTLNQQRIKDFIAKGKGAVGICAGAYLFSNTPDYTCIQLNGQQAIDIEHDNRGHGLAKFTLCEEGKKIFPELADRDTSFVIYYEGPVFINNPADTIQSNTLAIMESDVHEEGNAFQILLSGESEQKVAAPWIGWKHIIHGTPNDGYKDCFMTLHPPSVSGLPSI